MKYLLYLLVLCMHVHTYTIKIVGLVAGCNEETFLSNCLHALAHYTDEIVYLDYHSIDNSLTLVHSLKQECNITSIIPCASVIHESHEMYNMLLRIGRVMGGTHFIIVTPTELISASCMRDGNKLKKIIANLSPGQSLALPYVYVAEQADYYYKQNDMLYNECIFADDSNISYTPSDKEGTRIPSTLKGKKWFWENDDQYVLLNFAYNDPRKQLLRHVFNAFYERVQHYVLLLSDRNVSFENSTKVAAPHFWYKGYESFFSSDASYAASFYEAFICAAIETYGLDAFADIKNISSVDWNHILNSLTKNDTLRSQYHQDLFMDMFIFRGKKEGIYIDIGAHDGEQWSNTYFFEKSRNWKGICIEPLTQAFELLKKNRSALCINACVGSYDGIAHFYSVEGAPEQLSGLVDTYHPSHKERMEKEVIQDQSTYRIEQKNIYTLDTILKEHNITHVDYLSIDTEGSEWDIIRAIDFDRYYIKAMSIENMYHGDALHTYLQSKGFQYVARLYECDDIFINTKREQ